MEIAISSPSLFQNHTTFVHIQNTNKYVFNEPWEISVPPLKLLNHMYYFYDVFMFFLRCENFGGMDFKGVIWCDFKFCFLFGVLQADCA